VDSAPFHFGLDREDGLKGVSQARPKTTATAGLALPSHGLPYRVPDWQDLIRTIVEPGDRRNREDQQQANGHKRQSHKQIEAGSSDAGHNISRSGKKPVS
jgi:hypothetical protein